MDFFVRADAMIDLRTESLIIADLKCQSAVPLVHRLPNTKTISAIRLMEDRPRVVPRVEEMEIIPEAKDSPNDMELAKPKVDTLAERVEIQEPCHREVNEEENQSE